MKVSDILVTEVPQFFRPDGDRTTFPTNKQVLSYLEHLVISAKITRNNAAVRIAKEIAGMNIHGSKSCSTLRQ